MLTGCSNAFQLLLSNITIGSNDPNVTHNDLTGGNDIISPSLVIWPYVCAELNHN